MPTFVAKQPRIAVFEHEKKGLVRTLAFGACIGYVTHVHPVHAVHLVQQFLNMTCFLHRLYKQIKPEHNSCPLSFLIAGQELVAQPYFTPKWMPKLFHKSLLSHFKWKDGLELPLF